MLLSTHHIGCPLADTSFPSFRWQNAKLLAFAIMWLIVVSCSGDSDDICSWEMITLWPPLLFLRLDQDRDFESLIWEAWQKPPTKSMAVTMFWLKNSVASNALISEVALLSCFLICLWLCLPLFQLSSDWFAQSRHDWRSVVGSHHLPLAASFLFFWNPVLAHQTVKAPITTWGATEYFSSLGPELGPNTRFHQWCLLAHSVKSSTPDDLSLLSHSLGDGGSRLSETTCRWLGGDLPITTSYLIDLKSATAMGILWNEGAVTWNWTNKKETKAVRDWLGSSHIIGTKIHL